MDRENGFGSGPTPSAIARSSMNLIVKAKELDELGLWEKFVKLRKIKSPDAYLWGCVEYDEFEITPKEMKHLNLDVTVDAKSKEELGISVMCRCCKVRFSIFVKDINNFWFCPSCGDKLEVVAD